MSDKIYDAGVMKDPWSKAVVTITHAHHKLHEGKHYVADYQDITMSTDDIIAICFTTPDSEELMHAMMVASATGLATVELFENPTLSAEGTLLSSYNRDRRSANVSEIVSRHTPTNTSPGTLLETWWIGGAGFKSDISGMERGDAGFIFKRNEQYLVRLTAQADNIRGRIGADWYEHSEIEWRA